MKNNYSTEVLEHWGDTDVYREHERKTKNYTKEKWAEANDGLIAIFAEFAACKASGVSADSAEAQALVARLQAHITANYYTCTDKISKWIRHPRMRVPVFVQSALVLILVVVLVLILIAVLVLVAVLIVVLGTVLVVILIVHNSTSVNYIVAAFPLP